jgi:hypothetical protein
MQSGFFKGLIGCLGDPSRALMSQAECVQSFMFDCMYVSSLVEKRRCLVTCMCHVT